MLFQLTHSEMLQVVEQDHYQMFVGIPYFCWQVLQEHFNTTQFCTHFAWKCVHGVHQLNGHLKSPDFTMAQTVCICPQNSNNKSFCMSRTEVTWQGTIMLSSKKEELYLWATKHKCYTANFEGQGMMGRPESERPRAEGSWQRWQVHSFGLSKVRRVGRPLEANTGWLKHFLGSPGFSYALPDKFPY